MKIALVNHDDLSVWLFRRGLIRELLSEGHEVHILCGEGPHIGSLQRLGVTHIYVDLPRFVTPWRDIKSIFSLFQIFRMNRYDIVHLFQVKILVYGAIAARFAGIDRCVASSTGAGILFNRFSDRKKRLLQRIVKFLYARTVPMLDKILFQNDSDRQAFCEAGLARMDNTVVVKGSGVNLDEYSEGAVDQRALTQLRRKCGPLMGRVVVTMVGRAVETKGAREFIEASRLVERTHPRVAMFLLFGDVELDNPETLSAEYVRNSEHSAFRWLGWTDQVLEALAMSDIVVLPSYREGTPRALLEAMAMRKPIVTTDAPGCRNVVEDGRNGFMVPVKDADKLARAIVKLVENPEMRAAFGNRSYEKVLEEFEEHMIAKSIIASLYNVGQH